MFLAMFFTTMCARVLVCASSHFCPGGQWLLVCVQTSESVQLDMMVMVMGCLGSTPGC